MFAAFDRRDLEATLAFLHPEVELSVPGTASAAGRREPYRGHEGVRRYFADVDAVWTELEVIPEDPRAVADAVVIFGRARGRRRPDSPRAEPEPESFLPAPGEAFEQGVLWTWKLRDGLIVSGRVTPSPG